MSIATMIARSGHRISIEKDIPTIDGVGSRVSSFVALKTDVPAWIQAANYDTIEEFARRNLEVTDTVYVATDPEIVGDGYRIKYGDKLLSVVGVKNQAGLDRLWSIHTRRLT